MNGNNNRNEEIKERIGTGIVDQRSNQTSMTLYVGPVSTEMKVFGFSSIRCRHV